MRLNKEKGILSKKLATIMLDVPIEYDFVDFKLDNPNHKNVYEIFEELEFARMKENFKRIFIEEKQEDLVKNRLLKSKRKIFNMIYLMFPVNQTLL